MNVLNFDLYQKTLKVLYHTKIHSLWDVLHFPISALCKISLGGKRSGWSSTVDGFHKRKIAIFLDDAKPPANITFFPLSYPCFLCFSEWTRFSGASSDIQLNSIIVPSHSEMEYSKEYSFCPSKYVSELRKCFCLFVCFLISDISHCWTLSLLGFVLLPPVGLLC